MNRDLNNFKAKIKHFLISKIGKIEKDSNDMEFYIALGNVLKEEIMINWTATKHTYERKKTKMIYFLSMEYLPSRYVFNMMNNLHIEDLLKDVLKSFNRNFEKVMDCDKAPGLGNGGLGRLISCFMESLTTNKYPCIGYGLRYQYGIFQQVILGGQQIEKPDCWLLYDNPWQMPSDDHAQLIHFDGEINPNGTVEKNGKVFDLKNFKEVRARSYDFPIVGFSKTNDYNVNTLRLWSTKLSPSNFQLQRYNAGRLGQASENTSLTDVLYPNDNNEVGKRIRLKQEFLLSSASIKDMLQRQSLIYDNKISDLPNKLQIQVNDTHPVIAIVELIRLLVRNEGYSFHQAVEEAGGCCNYTNHTILKEALEEWNTERIKLLLPRQYEVIRKLNDEFFKKVNNKNDFNKDSVEKMALMNNDQVKMANLAIYCSKKVNGVSQLHTKILKNKLFKNFHSLFPNKFLSITNGVNPREWLFGANKRLTNFIVKRIGDGCIWDLKKLEKLKDFAKDTQSQQELNQIKQENKKDFLKYIENKRVWRDFEGNELFNMKLLDETALFDVQIKRVHEYKRQLMLAIHLIMLMKDVKDKKSRVKRMVIIGGKAAPGYTMAKNIICLIYCIIRKIKEDDEINKYLTCVFVENYNVFSAKKIIPAADLSEQISTAGMEASGTSNMKLSMNGALTIGTDDGANVEMRKAVTEEYWPFIFGATASDVEELKNKKNDYVNKVISDNKNIRIALDELKNGNLVKNEIEHKCLCAIYNKLVSGEGHAIKDYYHVLYDLPAYYEMQKKVETLYQDSNKWAEIVINNIAMMGRFSSDETIFNYVNNVWDINKKPLDKDILSMITQEFNVD